MADSMGLLDFLQTPVGQGLLSAGFSGLAGARRGQPINNLGRAGMAGLMGYNQAQQNQDAAAKDMQRSKLLDMQVQQMQEQQTQQKAAQEALQRRQGYLGSVGQVTSPRTDAQPNQFDPMAWIRMGGSPEDAQKLAGAKDWGRSKVARTIDGTDAQGNPVTLQYDEYGNPIGSGVGKYIAPIQVDLGGKVQFVKPEPGVSLNKTMTPDAMASNSVAWANVGNARDRLNFDKTQATNGVTYQQDSNGNFVALPSKPKPGSQVVGMPVVGPDGKQLTGNKTQLTADQAKALGFANRMQEADSILNTMAGKGVHTPSITKQVVEGTPLIGGALGVGANAWVASPEQQQVEQAQRDFVNAVLRRESGAAISQSEFDSARKQYFDQPGDGDAVRKQKARNRVTSMQGILAEVPQQMRQKSDPQSGSPTVSNW